MESNSLQPQAQAFYRSLQSETRAAIDRCADGLSPQFLSAPATPDEPTTTLDIVVRALLTGPDYPQLVRRMLMLLAQAARDNDAVALFTAERIATSYATREVGAMFDAGLFGMGVSNVE